MSKITICDWCGNRLAEGYEDIDYKVIVKKRWWSYDGFVPYKERTKLEICSDCKGKIISKVTPKRKIK